MVAEVGGLCVGMYVIFPSNVVIFMITYTLMGMYISVLKCHASFNTVSKEFAITFVQDHGINLQIQTIKGD